MIGLLDVNVLVALAWPQHIHHRNALAWFRRHQASGWATCPITESGFVRVSSNRKIIPEGRSPQEAIALLQRIVELPYHHFWKDDISMARSPWVSRNHLMGYRQVTDAHLLALARRHSGHLVTLDEGIRELLPSTVQGVESITLIPFGV